MFWVDPKEKLIVCMMVQNGTDATGVANSRRTRHEMRELVYQALMPLGEIPYAGSSSKRRHANQNLAALASWRKSGRAT
jgi:hypothetical protein